MFLRVFEKSKIFKVKVVGIWKEIQLEDLFVSWPITFPQLFLMNFVQELGEKDGSDSSKEEFSKEQSTKDENSMQIDVDSSISQTDTDK